MKRLIFITITLLALILTSCNLIKRSGEKTIFIGAETKLCTQGMMETQCMQVKWTKDQKEWENFGGNIEGFTYEVGNEYELLVKEEKVEYPPADGSSLKWTLIKEVSKKKVETTTINDGHNSQNAIDWAGTYEGTLPCADCEGIKTTITLNKDNTFSKTVISLKNNKETKLESSGIFEWNKEGNIVTLKSNDEMWKYQVGENQIIHLDMEGKRIEGKLAENYIMRKTESNAVAYQKTSSIKDKKWKLVEFMGKKINENANDYYLIFHSKDNNIETRVGCNQLISSHKIKNEFEISISKFVSTMKLCPDEKIKESEYTSQLETVNNYTVSEDGKTLSLNRNRMAPIAIYNLVK